MTWGNQIKKWIKQSIEIASEVISHSLDKRAALISSKLSEYKNKKAQFSSILSRIHKEASFQQKNKHPKETLWAKLTRPFQTGETLKIKLSGSGRILQEPGTSREALAASIIINMLALSTPLVILQIYDRVLPRHATDTLLFMMVGLIGVIAIDLILKTLRSYVCGQAAIGFSHKADTEAIARMMKSPYGTLESEPVSTHVNRLNSLGSIADFHASQSRLMMMDLPFVGLFLVILGMVGGVLVCIPILLFCIFAVSALRRNEELRNIFDERAQQDNRKYDFVIEVLSGIQTVKAFAMEPVMQRRFERLQQAVAEITYSSILIGNAASSSAVLYGNISQFSIVGYGAIMVINGQLSMGALACCTLLSGQILQPMLRTISLWAELQTLDGRRAESQEIFKLPEVQEYQNLPSPLTGSIRLNKMSYFCEDKEVFACLDLAIPPGQIVGIRGDDGSGRTTLLRLIRGELQPTSGSIKLDNYEPSGIYAAAIRKEIAYVGSSPSIIRGTILDNITLFKSGAARVAARDASALIGLEDEIHSLPDGYDTRIGEGVSEDVPVSFSQQIALARALASSPKILILDEANAVLDRKAETKLIRSLEALRGSLTILIVSHRPSMLAIADKIYEISQGILVSSTIPTRPTLSAQPTSPLENSA